MNNTLTVKSPAFENNGNIPSKYSCVGANISPPLSIKNIPVNTKSLALIMDDPDAPKGTFDHWIMWNIPVSEAIEENTFPGMQGLNGKQECSYTGPCPPSGTHHYHFKVYALDTRLELSQNSGKSALQEAMEGHIIGEGELVGLYKKKSL
ncbi:MAG: YbhB/YbcL family Raf kinase inhibitor-like protein [Bacteroidetes bacterium]|nr:YbhB/YbcL family Raf kinase inhibitor-like protein [Bacteroidota bacterium]